LTSSTNPKALEGRDPLRAILRVTESLSHLQDLDTLLDRVLLEARNLVRAEAGSIYLVEEGGLTFACTHNDFLFSSPADNKFLYSNVKLPLDQRSMAGYVALTGQSLVIDDAYRIPADKPYSHNVSFDLKAGYRTTSVLTVPLITSLGKIVGVMQIINALDREGRVVPFSREDQDLVNYFAANAAVAVERAQMTREIILRMIRMAEMRDPKETGAHVNRVGAYSAEIYHRWAGRQGIPEAEIARTKDTLRLAAMLHDVGKVAIADAVLKKPGRLDEEEYSLMKFHTTHGAALFNNPTSDLDVMSADIALNHHQRWNGEGYPDGGQDLPDQGITGAVRQKGEAISIYARIAALADLYDALISRRTYKEPWPEEKVLETVKNESGRHLDPQVVKAFFEVYETITAIRHKFPDRE